MLDGWHRKEACALAKVNVRVIEYKGKNPVAFVKSHNWHRRHMTESQKAMTQVRLSEWREGGGLGKGNSATVAGSIRSATVADLPPTSADMARDAGVSERTINDAKAVEKNGTDVLKTAVVEGEISVSKAAKVAKLPKAKQPKALKEAKEKKPCAPKAPKPEKPDEWKAKYEALVADYNELKENRDDLADEIKSCDHICTQGDAKTEMQKLRFEVKSVTRRRDELMANAVEMRKMCKWWENQARKLGFKRESKNVN